jgi:hypothetical protein
MPSNAHAPSAPHYPGQTARRGPRRIRRKCDPDRPGRNQGGRGR